MNRKTVMTIAVIILILLLFALAYWGGNAFAKITFEGLYGEKGIVISEELENAYNTREGQDTIIDSRIIFKNLINEKELNVKLLKQYYSGNQLKEQINDYDSFRNIIKSPEFKNSDKEILMVETLINNVYDFDKDFFNFDRMLDYYNDLVEMHMK